MKCEWLGKINTEVLYGKNILVAGGTGFIGKRCVKIFSDMGCNVTVITRKSQENHANVKYVSADLTDIQVLKTVLINSNFDHAIYMAANIPLAGHRKESYFEAKCSTLDAFINFCNAFFPIVRNVVYVSSVDVLGFCDKIEYTEEESVNNPTPYGLAKYCGELYTKLVCDSLSLPYKILRFSQVYGPDEPVVRIIPILKEALLSGKEFNLFTYGNEKRRFLYIDDAVQAVVRSCIYGKCGVYNIAGQDSVSMIELIEMMENVSGRKLRLNILKQTHGSDNIPSISKAMEELKYVPEFSIDKGMVQVFKGNVI